MPSKEELQEYQDYKDYQEYAAYQKGQFKAPAPPAQTSAPQAALEHGANVGTFGYLPELQAKAQPLIYKGLNAVTGQNVQPDTYEQSKQANAQRLKTELKEHPVASTSGMLAGGVLTAPFIPELGIAKAAGEVAAPLALSGLTKTAGGLAAAGRAAEYGAQGAGIGLLSRPKGDDLINIPERLKQAKSGAETGALLSAGSDALIKGIQSLPMAGKAVKEKASELAFKALGGYQRDVLKAKDSGKLNQIGETALKEGIVSNVPKSYEGIADAAQSALDKKGQQFEVALNKIADASQNQNLKIDTGTLAKEMKNNLIADERLGGSVSSQNKMMTRRIEEFIKQNPEGLSIKEAQDLKTMVGKQINWNRLKGTDVPKDEQYYRALYHSLNEGVESAADQTASQLGGTSLKDWQKVKEEYGAIKTAAIIADKRAGREFANRFISPSDYISGVGGLLHGGAPAAALAAGANHLVRKYGNQVLSKQAYNLGGLLEKTKPVGELLEQTNPMRVKSGLLNTIENKNAP